MSDFNHTKILVIKYKESKLNYFNEYVYIDCNMHINSNILFLANSQPINKLFWIVNNHYILLSKDIKTVAQLIIVDIDRKLNLSTNYLNQDTLNGKHEFILLLMKKYKNNAYVKF